MNAPQDLRAALSAHPDAARAVALMDAAAGPGYDVAWWREAMRAGWFAGGFPVELGGRGTFRELVGAVGLVAGAAWPTPLHNGVIQSGFALLSAGDAVVWREHVRPLLAGTRRYALCVTEPDGDHGPDAVRVRAVHEVGGWRLDGVKCWVPYAGDADVLLVPARVGAGHALFAVDPGAAGVATRHIRTLGGDRRHEVRLDGVRVRDAAVLGEPGAAWGALRPALARSVVALAADSVGAADAALRYAVERVRTRRQWGAPLSSFQVVRHRCADMLTAVEVCRDAVDDAVAAIEADRDGEWAASAAKAMCAQRCLEVTAAAHQLCGGEGIHADVPLHLWLRRIKAAEPDLGDARHHRARVADALLGGAFGT